MNMNGPMSPWVLAGLVLSGGLSLAALVGLVMVLVKSITMPDDGGAEQQQQVHRTESEDIDAIEEDRPGGLRSAPGSGGRGRAAFPSVQGGGNDDERELDERHEAVEAEGFVEAAPGIHPRVRVAVAKVKREVHEDAAHGCEREDHQQELAGREPHVVTTDEKRGGGPDQRSADS